ncbi:MAG: (5-formylfuran-3-yl)methyl phosphate synthase, partial [Methylophilaceae bacterium]
MTKLLVSVKNLQECELALQSGVDLIDLKAPQYGALGGLALNDIHNISAFINKRATTSATIGDIAP